MAEIVDPTESFRREAVQEINSNPQDRAALENAFGVGNVWDTEQLSKAFEVEGFMAPFAVVRRRSDGVRGSVTFQHAPRFYYDFVPDRSR
jgi:hypothetical protein